MRAARLLYSTPTSTAGPDVSKASREDPVMSTSIVKDDTDEWLNRHVERSVQAGRLTDTAASYFAELRAAKPEFRRFTKEARELIGDQAPDKMTRYQQTRLSEKLGSSISSYASDQLQRSFKEDNEMKAFQKDGTPTGQNYWMEAGSVLLDPSLPTWLRDEIVAEMKKDRPEQSPANEAADVNRLDSQNDTTESMEDDTLRSATSK